MLINRGLSLLVSIIFLALCTSQAQAQIFQSGHGSNSSTSVYSPVVNNGQRYQPIQSTGGSCANCRLPGPTVPGYMPTLPVKSCCNNNIGMLNIPKLTTPLRYDTPPIGRAVGRPLFGRWTGF